MMFTSIRDRAGASRQHFKPARSIARTCALAALLFSVAHSSPAHAGPVEQFVQVALHPANADVLAVRYVEGGGGFFYSHDRGVTWALMPTSAIDPALTGSLGTGVAADGTLLASGNLGGAEDYAKSLWQDDKKGCAFTRIGTLMNVWMSDIEPDPSDPNVLFAVSSGLDKGRLNGLWKRTADGTWSEVGPRERIMLSSLRVVTTPNGLRMYAAALREVPDADAGVASGGADAGSIPVTYAFVMRVSDDEGETWDEFPYGMTDPRASLRLETVDPKDPDTIVVSVGIKDSMGVPADQTPDQVLVSHDRGATFQQYQTLTEIGGAVFTPDGVLWIGDIGTIFEMQKPVGLWRAASLDAPATQVATDSTQCLNYQPASDTLYACQSHSVSSVDRETGKLTPVLNAVTAMQLASCAGQDVVGASETQLCGAYCGAGHFAQAPLCTAYKTPTCGPAAAAGEAMIDAGTAGSPSTQDAGTGMAGTGIAGASNMTGAAGMTGAVDTSVLDAGTDSNHKSSGGGCGCVVIANHGGTGAVWAWAWACAALLWVRRRQPRRATAQRD